MQSLLSLPIALLTFPSGDGPGTAPGLLEREVAAMGTTLVLELEAPSRAEALAASEAAVRAVESVEARLSSWRPDSELSRLSRAPLNQPVELSASFAPELDRAWNWRARTGGAFDPAIAPLVAAWDLRGAGRRPSPAELEAARRAVGSDGFRREAPATWVRLREGAGLDAGGFGKGAALDAALAVLLEAGLTGARLDFGGQVAILPTDGGHEIGVVHPDERDRPLLRLRFDSGSVASSGNSERRRSLGGLELGHLLDPRTGRPAPDFGSVSVWCPSAFDADCLSTALFSLGPDAGLALAAELEGVEALFLVRTEEGLRARATRGLEGRLHTLDPQLAIEWLSPPVPAR